MMVDALAQVQAPSLVWLTGKTVSFDVLPCTSVDVRSAIPGGGKNFVLEDYWTSVELTGLTSVPDWGVVQPVSSGTG